MAKFKLRTNFYTSINEQNAETCYLTRIMKYINFGIGNEVTEKQKDCRKD